jgi:hypothetical protein
MSYEEEDTCAQVCPSVHVKATYEAEKRHTAYLNPRHLGMGTRLGLVQLTTTNTFTRDTSAWARVLV